MAFKIFHKRFILLLAVWCYCWPAISQKTIAEYNIDLDKATSARAKADICFDIADKYAALLKIDSAIYFANKTKEYSEQANYETGIGKYHLVFAVALYFRNKNEEAGENASKSVEILTRQKETNLLGRAYLVLANCQYAVNKISLANKSYWAATNCFERSGNSKGLYSTYVRLARSYFKTTQIDSVSFYYIKALAMAEQFNDPEKIYESGCWLGRTFLSLGEFDKAIKYLDYGLRNLGPRTDKVGARSFLTDYATCLVTTHQFARADSAIKEVASLNAIFKDDYGSVLFNGLKGTLEYERKNYPEAVFYLRQACNKRNELELTNNETKDILLLLGKAEYETHSYDSAIYHLQLAAGITGGLRDLMEEEEANLLISKFFQQKGNSDSALHYFKKYAVLKDSILSQQKQKNIIEVTARYETEKKEGEIKILEKEKEANSYLLQLQNQQIEKQKLEGEKKSQQLSLISQQNEINKLDADQKSLSLDNEKKENEQRQAKLKILEQEASYQKLLLAKQAQQKKIIYSAIAIVLLLTSYGLYRYIRKKRLQNKQEVLNERLRISRELHDEVGATLSGVALFSEIAKQRMEEDRAGDAQVYLNHISANSKEMVEKMSDIVWSINPDNDSFERIITKLQSYAFNLCAGKGISLHLDIDSSIRSDYPVMQVKRNLYLFMKEATNNAIKYSGGKNIFLSLKKKGNSITAEIKDDGSGFDTGVIYEGNGLKNMKARADSLEGIFAVESQKGKGTSVRLQFHFHPAGGQRQVV
jgi:two-component system sensor histidine kinase UhpB